MNHYQPFEPFPSYTPQEPPRDMRQEKKQIASFTLGICFITLFTSVLQAVILALVYRFAPSLANEDWFVIVVSMTPMYLIAMPLSLLFYRMGKSEPPKPKRMSVLAWFGLLAICFALTYIGNFIGIIVNAIIGAITGNPPANDLQELTMNTPFWANLLFCGILAPIFEEIFYRKLVIDRLHRYGDLPAILISGILFGLIHGNFSQFFYAAMIGIVFGFIYLKTGKLRYSIGLHMVINLIGGVYTTEVLRMLDLDALNANMISYIAENPLPILLYFGYILFIAACMVAAPVALVFLWRFIKLRKADAPLSPRQWRQALLCNPATWVLAIVILLLFVL